MGGSNDLKISSVEQLQKITSSLYLVALRINESIELSGLTIADLVDRCISSIDGNDFLKTEFLHKIYEKYGKANDSELIRKFVDISMTAYEVSDDFPKIVPENIPHERILRAKYTIDGNSLDEYKTLKGLKEIINHGTSTTV